MNSSTSVGSLLCILTVVLSGIAIQMRDHPVLQEYASKNISSTKSYESFDEFYVHYIGEHKLQTTRIMHYLGNLLVLVFLFFNPKLFIAMFAGGLASYAAIPYTRHFSTGLPETFVFLSIYLTNSKLLTNSFLKPLLPLVLGYGCSWFGHFVFEQNKPAAFANPTYSFFGDLQMIYDAIKQPF